jgi:hypothetical protein
MDEQGVRAFVGPVRTVIVVEHGHLLQDRKKEI